MDCTEDLSLDLASDGVTFGVVGATTACHDGVSSSSACSTAPAPASVSLSFHSTLCPAGSPGARCPSPKTADLDLLLSQLATMLATEASGRVAVSPSYIITVHKGYLVPSWRRQIVEWVFDVAEEFGLSPTCAFAAAQLLDRFLSRQQVRHSELQMLGLACIIIASKLHESCPLRMVRVARCECPRVPDAPTGRAPPCRASYPACPLSHQLFFRVRAPDGGPRVFGAQRGVFFPVGCGRMCLGGSPPWVPPSSRPLFVSHLWFLWWILTRSPRACRLWLCRATLTGGSVRFARARTSRRWSWWSCPAWDGTRTPPHPWTSPPGCAA